MISSGLLFYSRHCEDPRDETISGRRGLMPYCHSRPGRRPRSQVLPETVVEGTLRSFSERSIGAIQRKCIGIHFNIWIPAFAGMDITGGFHPHYIYSILDILYPTYHHLWLSLLYHKDCHACIGQSRNGCLG